MAEDNTMIERVARALAHCCDDVDENWRAHERDAVAAIRAMREPTLHMTEEGESASNRIGHAMLERETSDHPHTLPDYDGGYFFWRR